MRARARRRVDRRRVSAAALDGLAARQALEMGDFFNIRHPYFRPLWVRLLITGLALGWALFGTSGRQSRVGSDLRRRRGLVLLRVLRRLRPSQLRGAQG